MLTGTSPGGLVLLLSFGLFFCGRDLLHLPLPQLQTLVFVMLVFTGQGTVYLVRERHHLWHSSPSRWMMLSSIIDVIAVSSPSEPRYLDGASAGLRGPVSDFGRRPLLNRIEFVEVPILRLTMYML